MSQLTSTITSKGQVTIPKRVREELGVGVSDKVEFVILDSGRVEVRPLKYQWKDLKGIVKPLPGRESVDFDDLIEEAMEDDFARQVSDLTTA